MTIHWQQLREQIQRAFATALGDEIADPDDVRALLDERARRLAAPPAEVEQVDVGLDLVSFYAGDHRYAIECRFVRSIVRLDDCTPVPGLPPHFAGIANVRGEIVAIIDLERLLGAPATPPQTAAWGRSHALVIGERDNELGILAAADDVVRVSVRDLVPPSSRRRDASSGPAAVRDDALVRGVTGDGLVVIDGAALLADPRSSGAIGDGPPRA